MSKFYFFCICIFATVSVQADFTPLDAELTVDGMTRIECEYDENQKFPKWMDASGKEHPKFASGTVFHYDLYLPEGYHENPEKKYPCMFISSPGGNARLGNLRNRIKQDKWIAVMLVESRNGSPDWLRNFVAAHDDVVKRVRIQEGMKFATGFSGGARCASAQVGVRPGFAGVILQGAGFLHDGSKFICDWVKTEKCISVAMIMGTNDSNKIEIPRVKKYLPPRIASRYIRFDGGHSWSPSEKMDEALDWSLEKVFETTKDKKIALELFDQNYKKLDDMEPGLIKYEKIDLLNKMAKKHKLNRIKSLKEAFSKLNAEIALLTADKRIATEISAQKEFSKVLGKEEKVYEKLAKGKLNKKKHQKELDRLIHYYGTIVKKYDGTVYSVKASEKVALLEAEKTK